MDLIGRHRWLYSYRRKSIAWISLTTLADLCDYYNVPLEDFFKKIVTR